MSSLENEFRTILEECRNHDSKGKSAEQGHSASLESESAESDPDFPGYSGDAVADLNTIANEMISGGHESECFQVYAISRRNVFEEISQKLGFEKISIDEIQKMQWEALEKKIPIWVKTFKQCFNSYLPRERKLTELVFTDHPSTSAILFGNLSRSVILPLLSFARGVYLAKRSADKLFKWLDMFETLREAISAMDDLFPQECLEELKAESTSAKCKLGEAAILIFHDLENSIKSDTGKTLVPGGAVHPLTRYTMNYIEYACEYKGTLEHVFNEYSNMERAFSTRRPFHEGEVEGQGNYEERSPFSAQLVRTMELLDSNLIGKGKLYKDVSLTYIFMMNNGRYIMQKIKGASEIYKLMGDTWCRKRSSELRQYHKNYQRETWNKLLGCLSHEGLISNGKVLKPVLKERFKSFNAMFDEIHKTQSSWVVSDEQLQSELRVSISAVIIPAYRSFLGRFAQTFTPGRQTEKYVKYMPEDLETHIDELFDGNHTPVANKRKPYQLANMSMTKEK